MKVTLAPKFKWWYKPLIQCLIWYHRFTNTKPNHSLISKIVNRAVIVEIL